MSAERAGDVALSSSSDRMTTPSRPNPAARAVVALIFAVVAGLVSWRAQYVASAHGSDHVILQRAVQILIAGGDPYRQLAAADTHGVFWRFFYPLPSAALGLPFYWMTPENAAIAFTALSAGLLGLAITRDGFDRSEER